MREKAGIVEIYVVGRCGSVEGRLYVAPLEKTAKMCIAYGQD